MTRVARVNVTTTKERPDYTMTRSRFGRWQVPVQIRYKFATMVVMMLEDEDEGTRR